VNSIDLKSSLFASFRQDLSSLQGLLSFEKIMFVIANTMDIGMTSMLLGTGQFIESNPIAAHILNDWGLAGMIAYKLIIVSIVMLIANIISIWKINTSKQLLHFGTLAVSAVVSYSILLMMSYQGWF
jgi:hypothetical protein